MTSHYSQLRYRIVLIYDIGKCIFHHFHGSSVVAKKHKSCRFSLRRGTIGHEYYGDLFLVLIWVMLFVKWVYVFDGMKLDCMEKVRGYLHLSCTYIEFINCQWDERMLLLWPLTKYYRIVVMFLVMNASDFLFLFVVTIVIALVCIIYLIMLVENKTLNLSLAVLLIRLIYTTACEQTLNSNLPGEITSLSCC